MKYKVVGIKRDDNYLYVDFEKYNNTFTYKTNRDKSNWWDLNGYIADEEKELQKAYNQYISDLMDKEIDLHQRDQTRIKEDQEFKDKIAFRCMEIYLQKRDDWARNINFISQNSYELARKMLEERNK